MTWKVKSEKRAALQYSYTGDQQITLSKTVLGIIGLIGTIVDFAVKAI